MESLWLAARNYVVGLRQAPDQIIAPSQLGLGIAYDTNPGEASIISPSAKTLVLARNDVGALPPTILATFCLEGEIAFANEALIVMRKRKQKSPTASAWLGHMLGERMAETVLPRALDRTFNGTYVDARTVLSTTWWGDMIYVVSQDASITPHILREGRWEHWIEEPFRKMLRPGMKVVDVGCNVGYYALAACKTVGTQGHVIAIDANPEMTRLVQMSVDVNGYRGMSRVINAAIMKDKGEVTLSVPHNMLGGASMMFAAGGENSEKLKVQGGPLDAYVNMKPVDVLKIDAEGAEPLIYAGGKSIITRDKDIVIFMEFASTMIRSTRDPQDFLSEIRADGFSVFEIQPGAGPVQVADREIVSKSWTEILLVRDPARVTP